MVTTFIIVTFATTLHKHTSSGTWAHLTYKGQFMIAQAFAFIPNEKIPASDTIKLN